MADTLVKTWRTLRTQYGLEGGRKLTAAQTAELQRRVLKPIEVQQKQLVALHEEVEDTTIWSHFKDTPEAQVFWQAWLHSVCSFVLDFTLQQDALQACTQWKVELFRDPVDAGLESSWFHTFDTITSKSFAFQHNVEKYRLKIERTNPQVIMTFDMRSVWYAQVEDWTNRLHLAENLHGLPKRHHILQHIPEVLQVMYDAKSGILKMGLYIPENFELHCQLYSIFPRTLLPVILSFVEEYVARYITASLWLLQHTDVAALPTASPTVSPTATPTAMHAATQLPIIRRFIIRRH